MEAFNKDKISKFLEVETDRELASVLSTAYKTLKYNLYKVHDEYKYEVFEIKKRNGGIRRICAPISGIKRLQRNLAIILNHLHSPKFCVHGYVKERSIITNAKSHINKRIVVNIDLKDFFPSINFGRVRGLFMSYPFNFDSKVSTVLAQICCFDGCLPQGAPSSPMLSNYICYSLDNQLLRLARECKVNYSRYADDITFSTNLKELPSEIGTIKESTLFLSDRLTYIIEDNGFAVNREKIRFAFKSNRQEVTGLIVNKRINLNRKYIRHVRAMIHAWEKYGIDNAAIEHFQKYNFKNKKVNNYSHSFINELSGKIGYIGHVKGKENSVYRSLFKRVKALDPEIRIPLPKNVLDSNTSIIFCEGITDGMHLTSALSYFKSKGEFVELDIYFYQYTKDIEINNDRLLKACQTRNALKRSNRIEIYLFDRDVPNINNKVADLPLLYRSWGKNIYSMLLPVPSHRSFDEICIEHYYTDEEIKTKTKKGFRIYLSNEFDKITGKHLTEEEIIYPNTSHLKASHPRIIDDNVQKLSIGKNIALPKRLFAEYISRGNGDFKKISFENFRGVFEQISQIVKEATTS